MKGVRNNFIVKCVLLIVVIAVGVIGLYYTVINNNILCRKPSYSSAVADSIIGHYPIIASEFFYLFFHVSNVGRPLDLW